MEDLIKALQIFLKYENPQFPTNCEHDELYINIDSEQVTQEDMEELRKLGFISARCFEGFVSYKFGSC